MKLVIGLGNPGKQYEKTRHNVGFLCLDRLANKLNISFKIDSDFKASLSLYNCGEKCIFVKPQTYMNLSGEAVGKIAKYYKIDAKDILVIHDDMDLPFGALRLREKGSAGGHNGVKNIILHLETEEFKRIRVGISGHAEIDAKDYVLGHFSKKELSDLEIIAEDVCNAILEFIEGKSFLNIMSKYNGNRI